MPEKYILHDWWESDTGFDLWSVPHFLFGVLMAFLPYLFGISFHTALLWTIILAVACEVIERLWGVEESVLNIGIDIVLPLIAIYVTTYLLDIYSLTSAGLWLAFGTILIIYSLISFFGWRAYRIRQNHQNT